MSLVAVSGYILLEILFQSLLCKTILPENSTVLLILTIMQLLVYFLRADSETGTINLYDGHGVNVPIHQIETMHSKPVQLIKVQLVIFALLPTLLVTKLFIFIYCYIF